MSLISFIGNTICRPIYGAVQQENRLIITFLGASPFCYLGAASAVRAQAALIRHLSPESGQILARDGRWSVWRAPCGFFLFNIPTSITPSGAQHK